MSMPNVFSPRVRAMIINFDPTQPDALTVSEFCKTQKISRTIFYRLRRRAARESAAALYPESRAPKSPARKYGPAASTYGGEIHDHRHVLVPSAGIPPHMFVNTEDFDAVEACVVVDQQALAFGQHCVVGGVPADAEAFGDTGHGQALADQPVQSPGQSGPADFLTLGCGLGQVFAPHVMAAAATVASVFDDQDGKPPSQGLVSEPADDGIAGNTRCSAGGAPGVRGGDWQRISAFAVLRCRPIAVSPRPSRPAKVVSSGAVKVELSNVEVFRRWLVW